VHYAATFICLKLAQGLAAAGWEAAMVQLSARALTVATTVATAFVTILIMFALMLLASQLWKQYDLIVDIYNFDPNGEWGTHDVVYKDNAIVPNGGYGPLSTPKFSPPGSTITPPGFHPIENLDGVCGYMTYIFENDSKFFQGLGAALQLVNKTNTNQNFMVKYNLPRVNHNQIGLQEGMKSLDKYFNHDSWASGKATEIKLASGLQVTAYTDYLSGAPNNVYTLQVNIGASPGNVYTEYVESPTSMPANSRIVSKNGKYYLMVQVPLFVFFFFFLCSLHDLFRRMETLSVMTRKESLSGQPILTAKEHLPILLTCNPTGTLSFTLASVMRATQLGRLAL
jgi:hypothetical protein